MLSSIFQNVNRLSGRFSSGSSAPQMPRRNQLVILSNDSNKRADRDDQSRAIRCPNSDSSNNWGDGLETSAQKLRTTSIFQPIKTDRKPRSAIEHNRTQFSSDRIPMGADKL